MIISASKRAELRETIAKAGIDVALSELRKGGIEVAKDVLERVSIIIGFLNQNDVPDWVIETNDVLTANPPK